jgi:hypothetical protein
MYSASSYISHSVFEYLTGAVVLLCQCACATALHRGGSITLWSAFGSTATNSNRGHSELGFSTPLNTLGTREAHESWTYNSCVVR